MPPKNIRRPQAKHVKPEIIAALELIPKVGSVEAAERESGLGRMALRRALAKSANARRYLERYLIKESINEAEHLVGLWDLNARVLVSAERAMASTEHEGEFEISERTALPLQVTERFIKTGAEILSLHADLSGAKKEPAQNPADVKDEIYIARLVGRGYSEEEAAAMVAAARERVREFKP